MSMSAECNDELYWDRTVFFVNFHHFLPNWPPNWLPVAPFTNIGWTSKDMLSKVRDEIAYLFLNFNGCTVEV